MVWLRSCAKNYEYIKETFSYKINSLGVWAIDKDGITPCLPIPTRMRLRPPDLSATAERMLQNPIYQCQLEGGYDTLFTNAN